MVVKATVHTYTVVFEAMVEGGYTVTVPMLPGVITEGETLTEARGRANSWKRCLRPWRSWSASPGPTPAG